jgi:3-oxoacyl-[acyl-carrier-protein] synthase III
MGATSTPPIPAMAVLSAQFTSAMRWGDRPVTKAPFSDSAAARVARPKRESRNHSPSAMDTAMMTAADHRRSPGTRLPRIS